MSVAAIYYVSSRALLSSARHRSLNMVDSISCAGIMRRINELADVREWLLCCSVRKHVRIRLEAKTVTTWTAEFAF